MTLLGLLARALGVTLLLGLLMLPAADHHVADRLANATLDAHAQATHHHGSEAPHPGGPTRLALDGTPSGSAAALAVEPFFAPALPVPALVAPAIGRLRLARGSVPPSLLEPPPSPPPLLAA